MRKRGLSARNANFLLKGKNIPYTGYDGRMRKRVQDAKKLAKDRGEKINKEYFYPKRLFRQILREYKKRSLKPEEQQPGIFERGLDSIQTYLNPCSSFLSLKIIPRYLKFWLFYLFNFPASQ